MITELGVQELTMRRQRVGHINEDNYRKISENMWRTLYKALLRMIE